MNQLIAYNNLHDGISSRCYAGFPLNSTLISSYTSDTIRNIINHAAAGKPFTTSVWIRISGIGIQISAQDPQIARTRIPVFIPLELVHNIFINPNINNVICIIYDEVKSNLKGVLLYVVHPTEAHLIREHFRAVKQALYSKEVDNQVNGNINLSERRQLFSKASTQSYDICLNGKTKRQSSPRRVLYVCDNELGTHRDFTPWSAVPSLPQLIYAPLKGSYHSGRENSGHRRHGSARKCKTGHSINGTGNDAESSYRRKHQSRSPQKKNESQLLPNKSNQDTSQEQTDQQQHPHQEQQLIVPWQAAQQASITSAGIYNRYIPKAVPLPIKETSKGALVSPNTNNTVVAQTESEPDSDSHESTCSPSRSRSISPKQRDLRHKNRSSSVQNTEPTPTLVQSAHYHHHRHHHIIGIKQSSLNPASKMYNTISHSFRGGAKYIPKINSTNHNNNDNNVDNEDETKQCLKHLIDDMQAMKLEMSKIRFASSSAGITNGHSDSLRMNLKELRNDIDAIRARIAM